MLEESLNTAVNVVNMLLGVLDSQKNYEEAGWLEDSHVMTGGQVYRVWSETNAQEVLSRN